MEEYVDLKMELDEPFVYDGVTVKEIDLSGIFDLTGMDMCELDREAARLGYSLQHPEMTRQYAMLVAAKVNNKPNDFCQRMKARDSMRLRAMVTAFFYARG